jgi:flagellar basal-body rod protein FlgC
MAISSLRISGSALTAERARLDIISQNIANVQTTRGADGRCYCRRQVVFETIPDDPAASGAATGGVHVTAIADSDEPMQRIYNPGHPDADRKGYVEMPNVNLVEEMVDMITASRAYEANVAVVNSTKTLVARALDIGRA